MAIIRDWLDLGAHTMRDLNTDEITNLYARDWTETRKALLAEHEEEIDAVRARTGERAPDGKAAGTPAGETAKLPAAGAATAAAAGKRAPAGKRATAGKRSPAGVTRERTA